MNGKKICGVFCALLLSSCGGSSDNDSGENSYFETNLAANKAEYGALFTFPDMINAWGIAIRPAGAGGHFWVAANEESYEFVGDVHESSNPALQTLHQDQLKEVDVPHGNGVATGMVFNEGSHFVITQTIPGKPSITAPAKFIAASDAGILSAWTERQNGDGSFDRSGTFNTVLDLSSEGAQFFGVALSQSFDRAYIADFGTAPQIRVLDGNFHPLPITFQNPFDANGNGVVDPGEFTPWNIQTLTHPDGTKSLFAAYVKTQACPSDAQADGTCAPGTILPGEEDSFEGEEEGSHPNKGRIAEFDFDGHLLAVWDDEEKLNAPWGMVFAPANFGAVSGMLLVGNFGGKGKIAAFDPATQRFVEFMKDPGGEAVGIPGIWGLIFGNGASLGDANALYFTAGPGDEVDGLFGSLRHVEE